MAAAIIYGSAAILLSSGSKEYIWLGVLFLTVGAMQIADAALWACRAAGVSTDSVARYGIITILLGQLLASYGGYVYYFGRRMPLYEIVLFVAVLIMGANWIHDCKETTVTVDGYLKWCNVDLLDIYKIAFLILLLFPFLYFPNIPQKVLLMTLTIGAWIYNYNHEAFGSRWCYAASLHATAAVGLYLLQL